MRAGATSSLLTVRIPQRGRAVGLEGPDLHLAHALPAVLGLAAQRLLRDERVGPGGTRMDLVGNEVVELHHVDLAHHHALVERLAGAAVEDHGLAILAEVGRRAGRRLWTRARAAAVDLGLEHVEHRCRGMTGHCRPRRGGLEKLPGFIREGRQAG